MKFKITIRGLFLVIGICALAVWLVASPAINYQANAKLSKSSKQLWEIGGVFSDAPVFHLPLWRLRYSYKAPTKIIFFAGRFQRKHNQLSGQEFCDSLASVLIREPSVNQVHIDDCTLEQHFTDKLKKQFQGLSFYFNEPDE